MTCTVLVLMGGPDEEHEVSLASGKAVAQALRNAEYDVLDLVIDRIDAATLLDMNFDIVFPVLHGPWGEGGGLQRELDAAGCSYVGSAAAAAATAMDKDATKALAVQLGIPTPGWELLRAGEPITLTPPLVIKPPREGSSIDLFICHESADAELHAHELLQRHQSVMVEQYITGRELTVGIVHNETLPAIEIVPASGCYDYDAKYLRDDTRYILDPDLPDGIMAACTDAALRLGKALGCRDLWRADFMLDERGPWLLELNTMPGFTAHSLLPKAAAHAGRSMEALCRDLVEHTVECG